MIEKTTSMFELPSDMLSSKSIPYRISYIVYKEEGDSIDESKIPKEVNSNNDTMLANANGACFGGLGYDVLVKRPESNRMVFLMYAPYIESDHNLFKWIELCRAYKLIPEYITDSMIENRTPVIKFLEHSPSLLYIYLTALRMPQEYPSFIRIVPYVMENYKVDVYMAWAIASICNMSNSNHNIINVMTPYGTKTKESINNIGIPIKYIVGFKRYMLNPLAHDKRVIRGKECKTDLSFNFNTSKTMSSLCEFNRRIKMKYLLNSKVQEALNASTDDELKTLIKESGIETEAC